MPSLSEHKRAERNRGKYRGHPIIDALFKIDPVIGKGLLLLIIALIVIIFNAIDNPYRYRDHTL